jgi:pimeloyl-ACP methyl ester carboxylesterase
VTVAERIQGRLQDAELQNLTSGLSARVRFEIAGEAIDIAFGECGPEPDIVISASHAAWDQVLQSPPPPLYHAFTAIERLNPQFRVSGDALLIAQARPALERVFELLRPANPLMGHPIARDLSLITGRYMPLESRGVPYDVYCETSGEGTPLVFLHTAGADSRQFQAQLSDCELAARYSMYAFDLPMHGRSMPPLEWDGGTYTLNGAQYLDWVAAFLEQVVREKAIVCGGSMGAALTLLLAKQRPDLLIGGIAVEPPFQARGRRDKFQHHAAVHGALHNASFVRGVTSPRSPEALRRRAAWIYSQGAPGIYPGDLTFYSDEFDGVQVAPGIDTSRTPLALLSGEYDYSASPEHGRKLAELISGTHFEVMPGIGHFPMIENPDVFKTYLLRALAHVGK